MNADKRAKNERQYDHWIELENGGRKYWFDVKGRHGGFARYVKVADENDNTLTFVQEIYNRDGKLVSVHEKYPIDKGHKYL